MKGQPTNKKYNNFDLIEGSQEQQPKQTETAMIVKKAKGSAGKELGKILFIADLPEDTCEEDLSIFFKDYEPSLIKIMT